MSAFKDQSGKINSNLFHKVLAPKTGRQRSSLIMGPAYGVDTAVIDLGNGQGLAASSDPVSLIPSLGLKESAWLTVHLLANDMATTGFAPQFAQFVLNLPPDFELKAFEEYWGYIHEFCDKLGVAITGGHTAQVPGQQSTTPGGGTMFLQAPLNDIVTADGGAPGHKLVVTKESALVSSSILAMSFPETVREKCGEAVWRQATENFYRTSSLAEALAAAEVLQPNKELMAMHDVTEGGVLGAIAELAEASGCGFKVFDEQLPASEIPRKVCEVFDIDHRFCVGAGSMIMAVSQGCENRLQSHLEELDIAASVVGELVPKEQGSVLVEDGEEKLFEFDGEDPYWKAFFKAMEEGWQ
ncbi:MAG: AIR synthase [Balneolaceae bacterium]|nr:AIR synthase [Balneolaceae bacterium]